MIELIFATHNKHKAEEIQALMPDGIKILTLSEIGCKEDIPETAPNLEGNAQQKARYVAEKFAVNCFADDTGLEIEALNNEPGVYSARYAGEQRNSEDNMNLVLSKLQGIEHRMARFRTVICLIIDGKEKFFEGIVAGTIRHEKSGSDGFGYDPIFEPENCGKTFAEMTMNEKNERSHRSRAFAKMIDALGNVKSENTLVHNEAKKRFELKTGDFISFVSYHTIDGRFILNYSEVPYQLRGQGFGQKLVEKTFEYLIEHDIHALATCSYIRMIAMRNPKWHSHISF